MKAKLTDIRDKAQVKVLLVLGVSGVTAFIVGAGVISGAPGRP